MDLHLNEEQLMIRDAARDFAQNEIAPVAEHYDQAGEFPMPIIKQMGEMGFMGIEVPEDYGGAGMDTIAYVLAMEEIAKAGDRATRLVAKMLTFGDADGDMQVSFDEFKLDTNGVAESMEVVCKPRREVAGFVVPDGTRVDLLYCAEFKHVSWVELC